MGPLDEKRIVFNKAYDDPYRVLAAHIVAVWQPASVKRIMTNNSFVKSIINNEARTMDISGIFLDCIDQEVINNDHLRQKNAYLKKLGEFYYSELDLPRLRKEIQRFADELGVNIS